MLHLSHFESLSSNYFLLRPMIVKLRNAFVFACDYRTSIIRCNHYNRRIFQLWYVSLMVITVRIKLYHASVYTEHSSHLISSHLILVTLIFFDIWIMPICMKWYQDSYSLDHGACNLHRSSNHLRLWVLRSAL